MIDKTHSNLEGRGLLIGFLSYTLWGFFPIFWKFLDHRSPIEILAHRMFWAFVFYLGIYLAFSYRDLPNLLRQSKRNWWLSIAGSALLTLNWGIYVYAVNSGHILESSLAYFINPILNVAVGVFIFKENFPLPLRVAVLLAAIGVTARVALSPEFPWISLVLATTFCIYGITKKLLRNPAMQTSVLEGLVSSPFAAAAIIYFQMTNAVPAGPHEWILFALGGVVTGLPLLLFSYAAQRIPYSIMGLLQFIAPSLQFLVAIVIFHEPLGIHDFVSFGFIWVGITFYVGYNLRPLFRDSSLKTANRN
jgi:chloramphenicol-sensitive protein RarD